jgi:hypothetical protein
MSFNLIRNSRVFFTTNVDSAGSVLLTGLTKTNTFELQVQDGFSFSQATTQETVTLNEAGLAPVRGQRSFNTTLEPVDWSFSTYIRPKFEQKDFTAGDETVGCEESVLWNAIAGTGAIGQTGAGWTVTPSGTVSGTPVSTVAFGNSNAHQLQRFGLIIAFETAVYVINNCAVESATIDFGLDAIASIAWAGRGTTMRQVGVTTLVDDLANSEVDFSTSAGGLSGAAKIRDVNAKYITNKLSTMTLARTTFQGQQAKTYTIALTGGSLTIANNLTYLTPANLGVVNAAVAQFTGTRAISASVNCYLRTGTNESATLLSDLLTMSTTDDENQFNCVVDLGGSGNANRVSLEMPFTMLGIPAINSEQVISTTINLMPQAGSTTAYNIANTNELSIKYYASL